MALKDYAKEVSNFLFVKVCTGKHVSYGSDPWGFFGYLRPNRYDGSTRAYVIHYFEGFSKVYGCNCGYACGFIFIDQDF
jgi:hypothetical protein